MHIPRNSRCSLEVPLIAHKDIVSRGIAAAVMIILYYRKGHSQGEVVAVAVVVIHTNKGIAMTTVLANAGKT